MIKMIRRRSNLLELYTTFPWRRKILFTQLAMTFLIMFLLIPSSLGSASRSNNGESVPFCSEHSPLNSKFFVPFFESHRDVTGCVSGERNSQGVSVHVLRIETDAKNVLLTITGMIERKRI